MKSTFCVKLMSLKTTIKHVIPESARPQNIWNFLGWSEEASKDYLLAKEFGIDLRSLIAPEFSDIVSIVVDGAYGFPYAPNSFSWENILNGEFLDFSGKNAKERLLSVIDVALQGCLDS